MNILIFDDLRDDNIHKNKSIYNNTKSKTRFMVQNYIHNKDEREREKLNQNFTRIIIKKTKVRRKVVKPIHESRQVVWDTFHGCSKAHMGFHGCALLHTLQLCNLNLLCPFLPSSSHRILHQNICNSSYSKFRNIISINMG